MGPLIVLGWIWASPSSLFALLLGLFGLSKPTKLGNRYLWVWEIAGGPLLWFFKHWTLVGPNGIGAQTIGNICLLRGGDERLVSHESRHGWQNLFLGPLQLPIYFVLSGVAWLQGRHPYRDNLLEVDARNNPYKETANARDA